MKKEQTVKKNNNKKTPRNKKHFFPEMQTRTAAQFFFFYSPQRGWWGFLKLGGKFFRRHLTRGLPATPYLFLPASSNLLCSAEWKWRMIGLVSVRPRKPLSLSKLPSPRACHLFIDDGYGGLTKNPPRLQLGEMTLRGAFFFGRVRQSISSHKAQLSPLAGVVDMATIGITAHGGLSLAGEEGDSGSRRWLQ